MSDSDDDGFVQMKPVALKPANLMPVEMADVSMQCKRHICAIDAQHVLANRNQQISNFAATASPHLPNFQTPSQFKKHENLRDAPFFVSPTPLYLQRSNASRNPTLLGAQFQGEELAVYLILEGDTKYVNTSTYEIDPNFVNSVFCQLALYRAPHPACGHPQHSVLPLLLKAQFSELRILHDGYPEEQDAFPREKTTNFQELLARASKTSVHFMMVPRMERRTRVFTHNDLASCLASEESLDTLSSEELQRTCDEKFEAFATSTPHDTVNAATRISPHFDVKEWMTLCYHHARQHSSTSGIPNALSSRYDLVVYNDPTESAPKKSKSSDTKTKKRPRDDSEDEEEGEEDSESEDESYKEGESSSSGDSDSDEDSDEDSEDGSGSSKSRARDVKSKRGKEKASKQRRISASDDEDMKDGHGDAPRPTSGALSQHHDSESTVHTERACSSGGSHSSDRRDSAKVTKHRSNDTERETTRLARKERNEAERMEAEYNRQFKRQEKDASKQRRKFMRENFGRKGGGSLTIVSDNEVSESAESESEDLVSEDEEGGESHGTQMMALLQTSIKMQRKMATLLETIAKNLKASEATSA